MIAKRDQTLLDDLSLKTKEMLAYFNSREILASEEVKDITLDFWETATVQIKFETKITDAESELGLIHLRLNNLPERTWSENA
ncbi:MAG: hypothetical protein JRD68_01980 [Deltaproteobacteria bacterium]|nr:hypothetical protein [Deltaproteobacteria bacterium]